MFDEMTHRNTTSKVAPNENKKKQLTEHNVRIPKIWQILKHFTTGHFIKHKPLISEV